MEKDITWMPQFKDVYHDVIPPFKKCELLGDKSFDLTKLKYYSSDWSEELSKTLRKIGVFRSLKKSEKAQLKLKKVSGYPQESFGIHVSETITIESSSEEGIFYGVLSLYKLSLIHDSLPYAKVYSEPKVKERSLHLDIGRKYFSKEIIFEFLETMAFSHMNTLQLHFSENKGFRIECETFPEIVSEDFLRKEEILEIIDYAQQLYIQVIPSLDSPGHLNHALQFFPEYQLENSDGGSLDISNPEARSWVYKLYDEYAELFKTSQYFNIGGDEFVDFERFDTFTDLVSYSRNNLALSEGKAVDTYLDYLNELAERLEEKGFTVRVWNDGLYRKNQSSTIKLKDSIQVCYWTRYHRNMAELNEFVEKGHHLVNFHAENFYYVLHVDVGVKRIDPKGWFENWEPNIFSFDQVLDKKEKLLGSSYSIWCDAPTIASQKRIFYDVHEPLWAFASKMWNSNRTLSYDEFRNIYVEYLQSKTPV